jgi:hypothetical protein
MIFYSYFCIIFAKRTLWGFVSVCTDIAVYKKN